MSVIMNIFRVIVLSGITCTLLIQTSHAKPKIVLNAPMAPLFGFGTNGSHGQMTNCGYLHASQSSSGCQPAKSYGAWADGPMNPYKYGGNTYFQIPHSQNFRIKVPLHNWGARPAWTMEGTHAHGASVIPAQNQSQESYYNNRNWIFSVRNENGALYGLTHHEWYRNTYSVGGIGGFTNDSSWIASIGWVESTNGGHSWEMRPLSEYSGRVITVPEPSAWTPITDTFGFKHPSNVVKDGNYYYAFSSTGNYSRDGSKVKKGVALFRTTDISKPTGWQYWWSKRNAQGDVIKGADGTAVEAKWKNINHGTYLGNFGPQMPHIFWEKSHHCSELYAMNVRQHTGGKFITLGSKYCLSPPAAGQDWQFQAVFSWVDSLANPTDLDKNLDEVEQNGISIGSNNYYSFFDVSGSADANYQMIGNNPLLVATLNYNDYYHQFLTLSGF